MKNLQDSCINQIVFLYHIMNAPNQPTIHKFHKIDLVCNNMAYAQHDNYCLAEIHQDQKL